MFRVFIQKTYDLFGSMDLINQDNDEYEYLILFLLFKKF